MQFNQLEFVAWATGVVFISWWLPQDWWQRWLLVASLWFVWLYSPVGLMVLVLVWLWVWWWLKLLRVRRSKRQKQRLAVAIVGVVVMITIGLIVAAWPAMPAGWLPREFDWLARIRWFVMPVGLAYYGLSAIGLLVDVPKSEKKLGLVETGLFLAYFPKIIAGPIEQAAFIKRLRNAPGFDYERVVSGMLLFSWGLFKKLLADWVVISVTEPMMSLETIRGWVALVGVLGLSVQLYLDFSGLIDMARGVSRVIGIELSKNFDRPWRAGSIREFWQRWHITLGKWFRDYVYIPLGGNRKGLLRWVVAVVSVFVASGLWHGMKLTFLAWGIMHALGYFGVRYWTGLIDKLIPKRLSKLMLVGMTGFWVSLAWVWFFSANFAEAIAVFQRLLLPALGGSWGMYKNLLFLALGSYLVVVVEELAAVRNLMKMWRRQVGLVRWVGYAVWIVVLLNMGPEVQVPFVYPGF